MAQHRRKDVATRNLLNDLTGTEWIKFTKSWFELASDMGPERDPIEPGRSWLIVDSKRYRQNRETELHPARYPEELVHEFLSFFTQQGEWVLDPFAGSGATVVAALETGRNAVGIELSKRYAAVAQRRLTQVAGDTTAWVRQGDAAHIADPSFWAQFSPAELPLTQSGLPEFEFIMTSPPYWDMLRHSRGGVESTHKRRTKAGLDTVYSEDPRDLGNIPSYGEFLTKLCSILADAGRLLRPTRYMVVVAQNLRAPDGTIVTLAWDIQRRLGPPLQFQGERIWCQNSKQLGIWGYPSVFVPNYHHHYCLIFRRMV
ncbi:MAG: DNA methyltransferase [Candidatus Zipacnadales bacterium]